MSEDRTTGGPAPAGSPPAPPQQARLQDELHAEQTHRPEPARPPSHERPRSVPPQDPPPGSASSAGPGSPTTVLPAAGRPSRPRPDRPGEQQTRTTSRSTARPAGRRRARLVLQRVDAWSVFLFSLLASICLGVVLLVAVGALYLALSSLGVLASLNGVLGEVAGTGAADEVVEPFITAGRVMGATAVLAAVDVVLLTALATLGALLYNLCASLTGGIEVQLGERD